uniref:Glycinamide ribonucleotide synthetase n=1 Tax=Glossina morsitans morsitans TaxID=37546 RepID=A0A1B0FE46_GLOMM
MLVIAQYMHDIEYIRKNPEGFEKAMKSRGIRESTAEEILEIDHEKRSLTTKLQDLNRQRNEITEEIKKLKMSKSPCEEQIELSKSITNEIEAISLKEQAEKDKLVNVLSNLPNIPAQDVAIGADENSNLEVRRYGGKRQFDFVPESHYELGEKLGSIDFEQAARISGSRFTILKGQLAKLGRALINFMLEMHVNEFGYTEVYHPTLVKNEAMYNVGQLPKFSDDSYLTTDELRLISTSEVFLTNLVADKIMEEKELPIRFTAYSECFRKEAGCAGRDTRGMIRQHQFGKVELVSITTEDQSNDELERMTSTVEEILKKLELPYRVMLLCSGDMGFAAQRTYDIEAMENLGVLVDVNIQNSVDVTQFCKRENIELVVIGPEQPIIDGLADDLVAEGINVFAPSQATAKLEGSKSFTKGLCKRYGIPTAKYECFVDEGLAKDFVRSNKIKFPLVVKANGIAAGKGVVICNTESEAFSAINSMLVEKKFGESGEEIIIEEFLVGEEVSFFALIDGLKVVTLGCAKDYKRVDESNESQNTGGMGSYSSPSIISKDMEQKIIQKIIYPTAQALVNMGTSYKGVLFAGLMICKDSPKLLEYNVRFGDPETQSILPRFDSNCDLLKLMLSVAEGKLKVKMVELNNKSIVCLVVASKGYPGDYQKGEVIKGLDKIQSIPGVLVFHAGTKFDESGNLVSDGGRVLNIVAEGSTIEEAKSKVYSALNFLEWPGGFFRYDNGS